MPPISTTFPLPSFLVA